MSKSEATVDWERTAKQLQKQVTWSARRLATANKHTEDATARATCLQGEVDILQRQLSQTHDRLEESNRGWAMARVERNEAQFWARKLMREKQSSPKSFIVHQLALHGKEK